VTDWLSIFAIGFASVAASGALLVGYAIHNEQRLTRLETKMDLILDGFQNGFRKPLKPSTCDAESEEP
jgi:hypothetical protein